MGVSRTAESLPVKAPVIKAFLGTAGQVVGCDAVYGV